MKNISQFRGFAVRLGNTCFHQHRNWVFIISYSVRLLSIALNIGLFLPFLILLTVASTLKTNPGQFL